MADQPSRVAAPAGPQQPAPGPVGDLAINGKLAISGNLATNGNHATDPASAAHAFTALPVLGLPEISVGDDLAALLVQALVETGLQLADGDILVVASKVVAKAADLRADSAQRVVAVLAESRRVVAERNSPGGMVRIVETLAGPVLAAAGIDASNTGPTGGLLLLPRDPDAHAQALRLAIAHAWAASTDQPAPRIGLIIADTAGRPWRRGQTDFALGACGVQLVDDLRGSYDDDGNPLFVTARAVGDELAAAADLVKGKTSRCAAVLIRGLAHLLVDAASPTAEGVAADQACTSDHAAAPDAPPTTPAPAKGRDLAARADTTTPVSAVRDLVRTGPQDWFAYGHQEAVRASLGVLPATEHALAVGVAGVEPDELLTRIRRACAVATIDVGLGQVSPNHPRHRLVRHNLRLSSVETEITQAGVLVRAPDPMLVGLVTARLLAALAGESVPAALARTDTVPQRLALAESEPHSGREATQPTRDSSPARQWHVALVIFL